MNGKSYTIQTIKVYALKRSVDEPGDVTVTDLVVRKIPWTFDTLVPFQWQPANPLVRRDTSWGTVCWTATAVHVIVGVRPFDPSRDHRSLRNSEAVAAPGADRVRAGANTSGVPKTAARQHNPGRYAPKTAVRQHNRGIKV